MRWGLLHGAPSRADATLRPENPGLSRPTLHQLAKAGPTGAKAINAVSDSWVSHGNPINR